MQAMKRAMFGKAAMAALACITIAACSPPAAPPGEQGQTLSSVGGWTRPPMILAVRRMTGGLVFTGQAEPGARVVLRSDSGPAYAAAADEQGRFELRMNNPVGHMLLRPETQVGQDAVPAPERLLVIAGGRGPVAILRAGGATRRLDRAPALGAVDSDGRMRLASGRSVPGGALIVVQAGGETGRVTPDAEGRWNLMLTPSQGADEIRIDDRSFSWPGEGAADAALRVERAGGGWRVVWSGPTGGHQTTWLPDAE